MGEYVYNGNGQRVKKTVNGQTTIFHYDQEGLLIAESTSTGTITNEYVYLNGKPLAKVDSIVSGAGYNEPVPRFRASMSLDVEASSLSTSWLKYYYTRNRLNLVSTSITGLTVEGNIVTVTGVGEVNGNPGYTFTSTITDGSPDAMGIEIYDPGGSLYYQDPPGGGTRSLIRGNFTIGSNVYYYHNDHLGTPMLMTDESGQIVWEGEYLPFGETLSVSGTVTNNLRFPGQYYDNETGLHYNYFRDYKPEIGRYLEADPILKDITPTKSISCRQSISSFSLQIPQELNQYVYSRNNPINFTDPLGLMSCDGKWRQVGWDRIFNFVCVCYWLCVPCDGPVIWGGNPRTLPRTFGTVINTGGNIESGDDCICKNRPGPAKECKKCKK